MSMCSPRVPDLMGSFCMSGTGCDVRSQLLYVPVLVQLNMVHPSRLSCVVLQAVRETSKNFLPFGVYHFIHGSQIRTPHPPGCSATGSAASYAEYAEQVCHHLDARNLPKIAWLTGFRTGGLMDHKVKCNGSAHAMALLPQQRHGQQPTHNSCIGMHSKLLWNVTELQTDRSCCLQMVAYQQRIRHHMDHLAMAHPSNHFTETIQPERENQDPAKLFDILEDAERGTPLQATVLDGVAQQLGAASKSAMAEWAPQIGSAAMAAASSHGSAAMAAASSRWASYWQKPASSSST